MALTFCPACSAVASSDDASCPSCGHRLQKTVAAKVGIGVAMALAVVAGLVVMGLVLGGIHRSDPPGPPTAAAQPR